uniref:Uncharacterized protein n=1 Tax=Moniliophthora roreri TaxID=221103 RepID=A0A0W0FYK6_MONRR
MLWNLQNDTGESWNTKICMGTPK